MGQIVQQNRVSNLSKTSFLIVVAAAFAACAGTGPKKPRPTVKQAVETAPADLQLACASRAATDFPGSGNILPLSSELIGADVFLVRLTSIKGSFVCNVNRDGAVVSLLPATNPASADNAPLNADDKLKPKPKEGFKKSAEENLG